MADARTFLEEALRRVIAGGDIAGEELDAAIPDSRALTPAERKAWYGLSQWIADDDIRARDPAYAPMRRQGLAGLLERLEAEMTDAEALAAGYSPTEVEYGDHVAPRMSGWGCLAVLAVLAAAAWALLR
jgi:hypothetical protein